MPLKPSPNFHDALGVKQGVSAIETTRCWSQLVASAAFTRSSS